MKAETAIEIRIKAAKAENRAPQWVMPLTKASVFAGDALLAVLSFMLAFKMRSGEAILSPSAWAWSKEFVPYAGVLFFAVPVRLAMLLYQRVYKYSGAFSYTRELIKVFKAIAVSSLLTVAWAFLFRGGFAFREFSYSRAVFVFDFLFALVIFSAFHLALRYFQVQFRQRDINLIPTLIVGTNAEAEQTIRELRERRDLGYRVIGVVAAEFSEDLRDGDGKILPADILRDFPGFDVIGNMDDLPELIRDLEIQEVIITDDTIQSERLFEAMLQIGRKQKVEFRFAPSLFNLLPQKTSVEQIGVLPMVRLFREPLSEIERFVKRLSDVILSTATVVILPPIFFW